MKIFIILFWMFSLIYCADIRMGYDSSSMSSYSRKDIKVATDIWMKELMADAGHKISFEFYDDPKVMAADLKNGKLDFVTGSGLIFVKYFDVSTLSDGFSGGYKNPDESHYIVIVPQSSSMKSWKDFAKKTVVIQKNDALAELYTKHALLKAVGHEKVNIVNIKSRQRAIIQVFFGKADAAIVTNHAYNLAAELNPQLLKKLKVFEDTGLRALGHGFFRKDMDEKVKKDIAKAAFNLTKDERGRQMLILYRTEKIVYTGLENLKPIQSLYKDYINLSGSKLASYKKK